MFGWNTSRFSISTVTMLMSREDVSGCLKWITAFLLHPLCTIKHSQTICWLAAIYTFSLHVCSQTEIQHQSIGVEPLNQTVCQNELPERLEATRFKNIILSGTGERFCSKSNLRDTWDMWHLKQWKLRSPHKVNTAEITDVYGSTVSCKQR